MTTDCLVIAHRGESADAPENTLSAFRLAWQRGAEAAECDVRQTADGHVVVHHDATTRRTAGVNKPIRAQTLAALRALDVGRWKGAQWAGEAVPTLEETLATVPSDGRLLIEVKCGQEVLDALVRVVAESRLRCDQAAFISFDLDVARAVKQRLPAHAALWLATIKRNGVVGRRPSAAALIEKARRAGLDGLDVGLSPGLDERFVETIKQAGMTLLVWTVNEPAAARRLAQWGVDGITTDRAEWIRRQLALPLEELTE